MTSLPTAPAIDTSSATIWSATPGRRAAARTAESAPEAAARTPYVGRRVADRPVDAPSGTLGGVLTLDRVGSLADRLGPTTTPVAEPLPPRRSDLLDTGTIRSVLAGLEPVDHSTSFVDEPTEQFPLVQAAPPSAGKRRAVKHSGRRGPLFRGLPSTPLVLGVAALAVSAGGAVTMGGTDLVDAPQAGYSQASALTGTSGVGAVGVRSGTTSRGSARAVTPATPDPATEATAAAAAAKAAQRTTALSGIDNQADSFKKVIEQNQWQVPLDSYRLTARFGQYGLWANYHTGLDFAAPSGTPIHAIANGVVTSAGYDGSYGNKTVITLDDGTELWYCHQTAFNVSVGDTVRGGDTIGYVGSTGNVTGPHVHIEVRPGGGDPVDPYPAFVEHGVTP